jgi:hypothetical protein
VSSAKRRERYLAQLQEGLSLPATEFSSDELRSLRHFAEVAGIQPEGSGGNSFDLSGRTYLHYLYEEDRQQLKPRIVVMKAAQMGLTVRMLFRAAWLTADVGRRVNVALMFPSQEAVEDLHKTRFRPMMQSSRRMLSLIEGNVDSLEVVRIGVSNMRFRGMNSGIAVDSFPADALLFDEVRLMDRTVIERAFARTSDSHLMDARGRRGVIELNSTAGFPNSDIHYYFEQSTQKHWHTHCPNVRCDNNSGFVMAESWPKCVDAERLRYVCPKCGTEIEDTQSGFYEALGPLDAEWDGYAFNQIMKGRGHLRELWQAYVRMVVNGANPSEFYNSYLGLPHLDPDAILVTPEVFRAAQGLDGGYRWPAQGAHPDGWVTSMGIDQRPGEKHVTVVRKSSDGRFYLAHLEVVERSGQDAVTYCVELARRWKVDILVVDSMPAYDFAVGLGRTLGERLVWLAEYVHDRDQPIEWSDQRDRESVRKTSGEAKYEQIVKIDRYKHLLQFLTAWRERRVVLPVNLGEKVQEVTRDGKRVQVQVGFELGRHLENIVKASIPRKRRDPVSGLEIDTGQFDETFRHRAVDPHFVHSMGYAVAGLMRDSPRGRLFLSGSGYLELAGNPYSRPLEERVPLPKKRYKAGEVCGNCRFFQANGDAVSGRCLNPRQQSKMNVTGPFGTRAALTRCRYYQRTEDS